MTKWNVQLSTTDTIHTKMIVVRQGNTLEEFVFQILKNGEEHDLSSFDSAYFCAIIGDNVVEKPVRIVNAKDGILEYTMDDLDMQKIGLQVAYIKFEKDGKLRDATTAFTYLVIDSLDNTSLNDGSYIYRVEQLMNLIEQYFNQQSSSWEEFVLRSREFLEDFPPGGKLLTEIIDAIGEYKSLKDRLDSEKNDFESELLESKPTETLAEINHKFKGYPHIRILHWTGGLGLVPLGEKPLGGSTAIEINHGIEYLDRSKFIVKVPENYKMSLLEKIDISDRKIRFIQGDNVLQVEIIGGFDK